MTPNVAVPARRFPRCLRFPCRKPSCSTEHRAADSSCSSGPHMSYSQTSTHWSKRLHVLSVAVLLVLALTTPTVAGTASLAVEWDASSDPAVDGYIVEWGGSTGVYTDQVDVGDVITHTINGLVDGQTYHVVVRSRLADGTPSAASNEAVGVAAATGGGLPADPDPADPDPADPDPADPDPADPDPAGVTLGVDLDFDADSYADLGVYRPSTGEWQVRGSSGLELFIVDAGNRGADAFPVPADYDGDGVADVATWKASQGRWVIFAC